MQQPHAITSHFSKCFQILYILAEISVLWSALSQTGTFFPKRTSSGSWVKGKRYPEQWHIPWERWAVDSLIMIYYCVQGIMLFQKLYIALEYMVPKHIWCPIEISKLTTEWLDTFAVHYIKLCDILHKTIYHINDRKNRKTTLMF